MFRKCSSVKLSLDACFYDRKDSRHRSFPSYLHSSRLRTWYSGAVVLKVWSSPQKQHHLGDLLGIFDLPSRPLLRESETLVWKPRNLCFTSPSRKFWCKEAWVSLLFITLDTWQTSAHHVINFKQKFPFSFVTETSKCFKPLIRSSYHTDFCSSMANIPLVATFPDTVLSLHLSLGKRLKVLNFKFQL